MSQEFDKYREHVRNNLDRMVKFLARLSFADFGTRIDLESIEDDEFAEVFYGLDLLMDDLSEAWRELDEENRFSRLKAEIWKQAVVATSGTTALIQGVLDTVGPHVSSTGLEYLEVEQDSRDMVCTAEWIPEGEKSAIGLRVPFGLWREFAGQEYAQITPAEAEAAGNAEFANMLREVEAGSLLGVPCGGKDNPFGFIVFADRNEDRAWQERERHMLLELSNMVSAKVLQAEAAAALRDTNFRLEKAVQERTDQLQQANRELREDIERIRETELALRASEQMYRDLVETSPEPILVTDHELRVVMSNRAAVDAFGMQKRAALHARKYPELVAEADRQRADALFRAAENTGNSQTGELQFARGSGSSFLGEMHLARMADTEGQVFGFVSIVRDVTAKRKQDAELFKAQKLESVGTLAGGLAHDFNNVLTGIIGNLFMARSGMEPGTEAASLLEDAERAALRAKRLTSQLLTFSTGGEPVKEVVSLADIIENAARFCFSGSKVQCTLDIPSTLPAVEADKGQLDQVISNLLINADQAMPNGGTVEIAAAPVTLDTASGFPVAPGEYVRVTVRDSGVGIEPGNMRRIFDPYFTTKRGGSGLGLATAYSIIQKHRGHIYCESTPGGGAAFTFFLPATARAAPREQEPERRQVKGGGRVLIMDDDHAVRMVMEKVLERAGFSTRVVGNSDDAIAAYCSARDRREPFDLVLMDLTIPGGNGGKETIAKLREIDPRARAVVVSGYSNDPIMSDYRQHGFAGVLPKPFEVREFLQVVNEALDA
ncbi:MAG: PAS domain S-box protein [Chitinivibrionales bacterium]|nr:PAS domain S-box protein [Chitinivibrionales bacterium]MBD3394379.1 PAS domain S-box protein [Chitinivibrionales bacterium]